jgi:hypothetical protein
MQKAGSRKKKTALMNFGIRVRPARRIRKFTPLSAFAPQDHINCPECGRYGQDVTMSLDLQRGLKAYMCDLGHEWYQRISPRRIAT